jgi:integrase
MAFLEQRGQWFRVIFRHAGVRFTHTLDTTDRQRAETLVGGIEKNLMLISQKLLNVPEGVDFLEFVLSDGRVSRPAVNADEKDRPPELLTLKDLKSKYVEVHSLGALEENSLATIEMHLRHIERTLGVTFNIRTLALADLQEHVTRRSKMKGHHRRPLSAATVRKEVASLRAVWNWALATELVEGPYPNRGLKFPKLIEKPPFQTWQEVERKIAMGATAAEKKMLWDSVYLSLPEIDELLAYVKNVAMQPFVYPMFCFAAHTGARRSEMLRLRWSDIDFDGECVTLQERKRSKERLTSRRVPLSPKLLRVLRDWQSIHPGGQAVFCNQLHVPRSKTKRADVTQLTRNEAHHHFGHTLADSKWTVLRGWHVFRHSFVSNCASRGVDQRMIDEWVGHQTEEMRKRYRHLHPHSQRQALRSVFCPE